MSSVVSSTMCIMIHDIQADREDQTVHQPEKEEGEEDHDGEKKKIENKKDSHTHTNTHTQGRRDHLNQLTTRPTTTRSMGNRTELVQKEKKNTKTQR